MVSCSRQVQIIFGGLGSGVGGGGGGVGGKRGGRGGVRWAVCFGLKDVSYSRKW